MDSILQALPVQVKILLLADASQETGEMSGHLTVSLSLCCIPRHRFTVIDALGQTILIIIDVLFQLVNRKAKKGPQSEADMIPFYHSMLSF